MKSQDAVEEMASEQNGPVDGHCLTDLAVAKLTTTFTFARRNQLQSGCLRDA
jgi:hypothetical protein